MRTSILTLLYLMVAGMALVVSCLILADAMERQKKDRTVVYEIVRGKVYSMKVYDHAWSKEEALELWDEKTKDDTISWGEPMKGLELNGTKEFGEINGGMK